MGKTPKAPAYSEAIVLSVQLIQGVTNHGVDWTVDIVRPGRDGHFSRSWKNASGCLTADQLSDLSGWVQRTVHNAVVAWGGIQGVMEV